MFIDLRFALIKTIYGLSFEERDWLKVMLKLETNWKLQIDKFELC